MGAGARHAGWQLAGAWAAVATGLFTGTLVEDRQGRDTLSALLADIGLALAAFVAMVVLSARAARAADVGARPWWVAVALGATLMTMSLGWDLANELFGHESTDYALVFLVGLPPTLAGSIGLLVRSLRASFGRPAG